jgi:hypothetical protein
MKITVIYEFENEPKNVDKKELLDTIDYFSGDDGIVDALQNIYGMSLKAVDVKIK